LLDSLPSCWGELRLLGGTGGQPDAADYTPDLVRPGGEAPTTLEATSVTDISKAIRAYILEDLLVDEPPDSLDENTHLIEEELLDSLGIFTMVTFLEERFSIQIDPEEVVLDNFETIGTIEQLVQRHLDSAK
jgi:acyl carrier protein